MKVTQKVCLGLFAVAAAAMVASAPATAQQQRQQPQQQPPQPQPQPQQQQQQKPNILFIMGDDIGIYQPSIYHRGFMVGETPNIDKIGNEGAIFMDYVAMQSCTSGLAPSILRRRQSA